MHLRLLLPLLFVLPLAASAQTPCVDGQAGEYECQDIDLLSHLSQAELGFSGSDGNDIWGWTDPATGKEYALMGLEAGTAFVDVTNPTSPVVIGTLPSHTGSAAWRDIKTIGNYAYVVSDGNGDHGVQIFDLTRLENVTSPPVVFTEDGHYSGGVGSAHNIISLPEAEIVIPVGSWACSAGLEILDVSNPLVPTSVGCYADTQNAYVHDAQCVVYNGPDTEHNGDHICFTSSEDFLGIVDITTPSNPELLSRAFYPNEAYTHQGWLTEDGTTFILDDELTGTSGGTRTFFFDVQDLENPEFLFMNEGPETTTAHNLYIRDNLAYHSAYKSGLRIWDVTTPQDQGSLSEIAWFDTYPSANSSGYQGSWSNYPYFESGAIIMSDIDRGLFVMQAPDISVIVSTFGSLGFSASEVEPGETVTVTSTALTRNPDGASGFGFSNTLPEGLTFAGNLTATSGVVNETDGVITWDVDLAPEVQDSLSFDVVVDAGTPGGLLQNTATITPPNEDPYTASASLQVIAAPPNDDVADAIVLTENGTYDGTNVDASTETDVPAMSCGFGDRVDVWWSFTATADGMATISTEGSDFDTVLSLHDADLTEELDCNDDNGNGGLWSLLEDVPVTEGETYLVRIAGYNTNEGIITFNLDVQYAIADEASPDELADVLSAPTPNPASGITTFTVAVDNGQDVTVEVFDATGRRVQTLYDGALSAGTSETLALDTSALPAGVYVIRASGEDVSKTRRVTVIR